MFKRFYFTCFSETCIYYEKIRVIVVPAINIESGGTAYQVPELWCDSGYLRNDPHRCIGPFGSEGELHMRINRRRMQKDIGGI